MQGNKVKLRMVSMRKCQVKEQTREIRIEEREVIYERLRVPAVRLNTRFHLAMHGPTKCTHKIFIKISYSTSLKIKIAVDEASMEAALHVCN
jgi:hypothetical protein